MSTHPHLNNAPIKEALIDFRVEKPEGLSVNHFKKAASKYLADYSNMDELKTREMEFKIDIKDDNIISRVKEPIILGYRFTNEVGNQVVQFRTNGFSFSRLGQYDTWEAMSEDAQRLWEIYAEISSVSRVVRVATRFINVMRIPLPITDLSEYLTAPPSIPNSLPLAIGSFLTRIVIRNPKISATGIITQALDTIEDDYAPITLDIDVFVDKVYEANSTDQWDCLRNLRNFKNDIFHESITNTTKELFQ